MFGNFGFSMIGLTYLLMLLVPNFMWATRTPAGYPPKSEPKILAMFEKAGQVLCTASLLVFDNCQRPMLEPWLLWLVASFSLMLLYEAYWCRYFKSPRALNDFYAPLLGIPLPGATLPAIAFFLLGIYGRAIWLVVSALIFGIGHIGIHWQHAKNL